MITLSRFDGRKVVVNAELIKTVEQTPDTMLTLINGDHLMVRESLEEVVGGLLGRLGWRMASLESGTAAALASALTSIGEAYAGGMVLASSRDSSQDLLVPWQTQSGADLMIQLSLEREANRQRMHARFVGPFGEEVFDRSYGGPLPNASQWAVNIVLDHIRRILLKIQA